ncbi:hypothetical protein ACWD5B_05035 [Streptomyces tanashiensis]|uniref:hypothetical protein n=1 Tax=Streptomyces tanashiensis TaxID=67367 RepID=UPI00368A0FF0
MKAEHREPAPAAPVVDLMAALEKSAAEARERRGEPGPDAAGSTVHKVPKPKKTAATMKTVVKETAGQEDPGEEDVAGSVSPGTPDGRALARRRGVVHPSEGGCGEPGGVPRTGQVCMVGKALATWSEALRPEPSASADEGATGRPGSGGEVARWRGVRLSP